MARWLSLSRFRYASDDFILKTSRQTKSRQSSLSSRSVRLHSGVVVALSQIVR
jgi:hypothetical protein